MRLVRPLFVPGITFFLGHVPMQWTVVAIATRGGADGEGVSPSTVSNSQRSAHLISPTPPGLRPPPPP
jgi:hypothetical protein